MAMFLVGAAGSVFALWYAVISNRADGIWYPDPKLYVWLQVTVLPNLAMIFSGFFLRRNQYYRFNKGVAWLALVPSALLFPPLGVIYPINVAVGLYSLWVLSREPVKLMFLKKKLGSSHSL